MTLSRPLNQCSGCGERRLGEPPFGPSAGSLARPGWRFALPATNPLQLTSCLE